MTSFDPQAVELAEEPAALFATFICGQPAVPLATLSQLLGCLADLLASVGLELRPDGAPDWTVAELIPGFSETTERQRIALELRADPAARDVADCVLAGIQQLRTTPALPAGFTATALAALDGLAQVLEQGVVELWLSRPGETPAFVTHATREIIAELAG